MSDARNSNDAKRRGPVGDALSDSYSRYAAAHRILFYEWDPIGICRSAPEDEYDAYLPRAYEMAKGNAPAQAIAEYLTDIERNMMGLPGDMGRARMVAEKLRALFHQPDDSPASASATTTRGAPQRIVARPSRFQAPRAVGWLSLMGALFLYALSFEDVLGMLIGMGFGGGDDPLHWTVVAYAVTPVGWVYLAATLLWSDKAPMPLSGGIIGLVCGVFLLGCALYGTNSFHAGGVSDAMVMLAVAAILTIVCAVMVFVIRR